MDGFDRFSAFIRTRVSYSLDDKRYITVGTCIPGNSNINTRGPISAYSENETCNYACIECTDVYFPNARFAHRVYTCPLYI